MNAIKQLRLKAGLSQADLAKSLSVTQGAVSQWENHGVLPCADKLPDLAKILGCHIDDLYRTDIA